MSLYAKFISSCIFPLHEFLKKHDTVAIKNKMEETQWLSSEQLKDLQLQSLKALLNDVAKNVSYYQKLFQKIGFDPEKFNDLDDLQKIPFLDKTLIRHSSDALKANDAKNLSKFNTGGSSGEPLIFYIGKKRVSHDVAAKWRATRWWGVDIGDVEAVIWGSPIELGAQDKVKILRDKLIRAHLIPAFEMSTENVDGFIEKIQTLKPKMLFGYPSALAHIAKRAKETGAVLNNLGTKVAFVTSERLYDYQRKHIENTFSCPVANGYGSRDAGFIAHQCSAGGMHITAEDIIVEIIGKDGMVLNNGELGEIVVTHLATRDFPFIRYRTGDVGMLSDELCSCGRGLPLLKEIQGRTTDFVIAQDGTVLHGLALIYVLRDLEGLESFKITQNSIDKTTIEIVKNEFYDSDNENKIKSEFVKRLGSTVDIAIHYKDQIAKEKSGKFRYVISHVKID